MANFIVTSIETGGVAYRYANDVAIDMLEFPFTLYQHSEEHIPVPIIRVYGGRRALTKLEFRRLFAQKELNDIDAFAANYTTMNLGVELEKNIRTNLKSYEEANDISLDGPDILLGLQLYAGMDLIAPTRITEVLNG